MGDEKGEACSHVPDDEAAGLALLLLSTLAVAEGKAGCLATLAPGVTYVQPNPLGAEELV